MSPLHLQPARRRALFHLLLLLAALSLVACAADDTSGDSDGTGVDGGSTDGGSTDGADGGTDGGVVPGPAPGVGQGGAQDFGVFRAIVEAGEIPSPTVLDDVGFFNEHKLTWPAPTCGDDLCIHGLHGVMGNMMSGANCTIVTLGLNTPINPAELPRPPLNLAIAVDTSGSMAGQSIAYVRDGLTQMLDVLEAEDRVTLVTYDSAARVVVEHVGADDPALAEAIAGLRADGSTNIYDGLRLAFESVERHVDIRHQNRVILLSDGEATAGIEQDARIARLASAYAAEGYGVTTIGVGDDFNVDLMASLAEQGSGNFYYLESPEAVTEVFTEEIETFMVPIAEDVRIRFRVGGGYSLREITGTRLASLGDDTGFIDIPSLFIAHRTTTGDSEHGRRGGGGGIVIELLPSSDPQAGFNPNEVGQLIMEYRVPGSETRVTQETTITSALLPGETPDEGSFDSATAEKAFVMLNIFVGLRMGAERAEAGDNAGAVRALTALEQSVVAWLASNEDEDIRADLDLITRLIDNIRVARDVQEAPAGQEQPVPEPWPAD